jgi:hypothetical protein
VSSDSNSNAEIAGCNGYNKGSISTPEDYGIPSYAGDSTVHPVPGSTADDSFIDTKIFHGPFDINKCSKQCSAQDCKFFNTYMVSKDDKVIGQYCDLYSADLIADASNDSEISKGDSGYTIWHSFTCPRNAPVAGKSSTSSNKSSTKPSTSVRPSSTGGGWEDKHPWCTGKPLTSTSSRTSAISTTRPTLTTTSTSSRSYSTHLISSSSTSTVSPTSPYPTGPSSPSSTPSSGTLPTSTSSTSTSPPPGYTPTTLTTTSPEVTPMSSITPEVTPTTSTTTTPEYLSSTSMSTTPDVPSPITSTTSPDYTHSPTTHPEGSTSTSSTTPDATPTVCICPECPHCIANDRADNFEPNGKHICE